MRLDEIAAAAAQAADAMALIGDAIFEAMLEAKLFDEVDPLIRPDVEPP